MNPLDIALVLGTVGALYLGWCFRALGLLGMALAMGLGILAANRYAPDLAPALRPLSPAIAGVVAWCIPFILSAGSVLTASMLLSGVVAWIRLRWLDRLVGALIAGALAITCAALFLSLAGGWAPGLHASRIVRDSRFTRPLLEAAGPWLHQGFKGVSHPGNIP